MLDLYLPVIVTLVLNAVLLGYLAWAFYAPTFADRRISTQPALKVPNRTRLRVTGQSSAVSLIAVFGGIYFFQGVLFRPGEVETPIWMIVAQALGILVVYDFAYYFLHRLMHVKRLMHFVHGVHHRAHNPSAMESFYLHPVELLAGLTLLFTSTWIVGPVDKTAFVIAFFVYSTLNILIHSGLEFRTWWLWPIDALTRKHYVHHGKDFHKNYSSLTPLPDLLFRTAG